MKNNFNQIEEKHKLKTIYKGTIQEVFEMHHIQANDIQDILPNDYEAHYNFCPFKYYY